ncbi:transposase [bacterium 19MO03SA05]|uniref:Transposase n=1 Tax=bacterium 19MO03SA05 TaxID=2920620 RepID=A0AAU6VBB5_UNCXX|nr:transposase [Vibrio metschnikovii]EKO3921216.1 transposase [Vibrio metschnikovii]MDQ2106956.1 transposase [Vibrio sp. 2017_1457_15]MDQ2159768.1 transposase [Vibrio sp. 2017_1457_13]MDQ2188866.1 transposase [Vibrio sp. A14(2019)]
MEDTTLTTARQQLVSTDVTSYYHCISRCVRRSFLCGKDTLTNRCYEHRREWIEQKIYSLTNVYCIDICAYAIMSNHYHLVVNINQDKVLNLTHHQVVDRWSQVHKLPVLIQRWQNKQLTSLAEQTCCIELIEVWRERLSSLSWFMKELNYDIACKANREDNCTGHFWESRFKSQALLDEKALVAAMAYVDLNPIRAGIADTPETSEFTSIKARINALSKNLVTAPCLHPFIGNPTNELREGIPFRLMDYLELVDWTARQYRDGKASMSNKMPNILSRLSFNSRDWLKICIGLEKSRATAIGTRPQAAIAKVVFKKQKMHLYLLE